MGASIAVVKGTLSPHWDEKRAGRGHFRGGAPCKRRNGPTYPASVFLGGDAVYRHAMTALKRTAAALVALLASPAHADVSGPVCVTDGDTLVVNGKHQRTRCVGGTRVRLFGIDAPELKQTCKHPSGRDFLCGRAAAAFLLEHVRGRAVECRGNSEDRYVSRSSGVGAGGHLLPSRQSHGGTNLPCQSPSFIALAAFSART